MKKTTLLSSLILVCISIGAKLTQLDATAFFSDHESVSGRVIASNFPVASYDSLHDAGFIFELDQELERDSQNYLIHELIKDGSFEFPEINSWQLSSDSKLIGDDDIEMISPISGLKMLEITASAENGTNPQLVLSQSVSLDTDLFDKLKTKNIALQPQCLSFWINVFSQTHLKGFNDPFLLVKTDDIFIHQTSIDDHILNDQFFSGWKNIVVALPPNIINNSKDSFELAFYLNNFGDDQNYPSIFIDNISTNCVFMSSNSKLYIKKFSELLQPIFSFNYSYSISGNKIRRMMELPSLDFISFESSLDDYIFEYWLENSTALQTQVEIVPIYFSNNSLQGINDLETHDDGDEFSLSFSSPNSNLFDRVSRYEFKYAEIASELEANWLNSANLLPKNIGPIDFGIYAPHKQGEKEIFVFDKTNINTPFYASVKFFDYFGNPSSISNIIYVESDTNND